MPHTHHGPATAVSDHTDDALRRQARHIVTTLDLHDVELAPDLVHALLRAGFGIQADTPTGGALTGGVEIRSCPEHYGPGSLLVSWAPHEMAYTPLDPRVTHVEGLMTCALLDSVRALGFRAKRLGASYSVQVQPWGSGATD
ncbi:hypothetical protein [Streptomyces fumanus]|uniref:Uncharacterized protein n=1 Tax=Streptomyces fumanus TaxID=67302 RepID=A0A919AJX8_9ACTN|nr:hypothetical protein [Streptomyces fumanus]GHF11524.1 hypothetical protein GCM10018772_40790 [Streptomyces fumanus]